MTKPTPLCKHPDHCPKKAQSNGWCHAHYMRIRRTGEPGPAEALPPGRPRERETCTIEGCDKPFLAKGLCRKHYMRKERHGTTANPEPTPEKCQHAGGCSRQYYAGGFCNLHYWRQRTTGEPGPVDAKYHKRIEVGEDGKVECATCTVRKVPDDFPVRGDGRLFGSCKSCRNAKNQIRNYGISVSPSDVCAICGHGSDRMHVDHDHKTGKTRGILCGRCNNAIGLLDDDPNRLRAAAAYLDKHSET